MAACRRCGAPLGPDGICVACLLARGLETDIAVAVNEPEEEAPWIAPDGDSFDPYRIVCPIGEGGMGTVYLARQIEPLRRDVALKVIQHGSNSAEVLSRFNYELETLALMDHPNIARVYDAGASKLGRPYFVMEYVDGLPITHYCDQRQLNIEQRLELFAVVCEALQHAHQKGVIHRDIKPSNILVAESQGQPTPKLIDFGIARATEQRAAQTIGFTHFGQVMGTPEYMSPEQADPVIADVDTSSDVYSLGVLLYELLTGVTPFDVRAVRNGGISELLRLVREQEATPMGAKLARMADDSASHAAQNRNTDVASLRRLVRGDLNSIVMRAMEKDRQRRYPTAAGLAADIRRYLSNEPVLASSPGVMYRAGKFARRHRWAVATAGLIVVVLIVAGVAIARQTVRANREAAVAAAVNNFLRFDLLAQASLSNQAGPNSKPDPDLTVRTALDRASARIAGKFDSQPQVEASIRDTIGETYMDLGLFPEARKQLEQALDLRRRVLGEDDPKTARTISRLGRVALLQGKYTEAEKLLSRALAAERRTLGSDHPDTLYSMSNLAVAYRKEGNYAQAEVLQNDALEVLRRVQGPDDPETLKSMGGLASVYSSLGKNRQAEKIDTQLMEIRRRLRGPESPETLYSMTNLAFDYLFEGKYTQAETLINQTLESERSLLGDGNSATLHATNILALVYYEEGKYARAVTLHKQTLELMRRVLGPENLDSLIVTADLAADYSAQRKYTQAEALFNRSLEAESRIFGPNHPATLDTRSGFGQMYQQWGKYDLAENYAAQAFAGRQRALGAEHPKTLESEADLALAYLSDRKFAQAEPLARRAFESERHEWPYEWEQFRAESLWGASLAGEKKYREAEPLLLESYHGMLSCKARIGVPQQDQIDHAAQWIVDLYSVWGKPGKAAEWKKAVVQGE